MRLVGHFKRNFLCVFLLGLVVPEMICLLTMFLLAFGQSSTALFRLLVQSLHSPDCEIVVSILCHEAGITSWIALAKSLGITLKWWAPLRDERNRTNPKLSLATLKPLLSPKTRLLACGHVNNNFGSVHPLREIADLVHTIPGALLSVDGVAWAPHRPIDVRALDVYFYTFSWYKVFGPHFAQIYARRSVHQRYLESLNLHHLEPSTLDIKLALGTNMYELEDSLISIIEYLEQTCWDKIIKYKAVICKPLLDYLNGNSHIYTIYGEKSWEPELRVSCVCFKVNGVSSYDIAQEVHNTSECRIVWGDNYSLMAVHDLLGLDDSGILRCSLAQYNTVEEVITLIGVLDRVVS